MNKKMRGWIVLWSVVFWFCVGDSSEILAVNRPMIVCPPGVVIGYQLDSEGNVFFDGERTNEGIRLPGVAAKSKWIYEHRWIPGYDNSFIRQELTMEKEKMEQEAAGGGLGILAGNSWVFAGKEDFMGGTLYWWQFQNKEKGKNPKESVYHSVKWIGEHSRGYVKVWVQDIYGPRDKTKEMLQYMISRTE